MKIEKIDKNFAPTGTDADDGFRYYGIDTDGFELSGFPWYERGKALCRLPVSILPDTNPGVRSLAYCTSGGALRFKTDAAEIALRAELSSGSDMNHMPRTGSSGFDLFVGAGKDRRFLSNIPPAVNTTTVEGVFKGYQRPRMREYTLYFPLYNGVKSVSLGFAPGATIERPSRYAIENPIVFYGASITQGGCASRPGNAFSHLLGRWLDADFVNLGFSGSSRGEGVIADAINSLDMSVLCIDYDQGEIEEFEANHEAFFLRIREKNPALPIIIIAKRDPKPNYEREDDGLVRRIEIIRRTYSNAVSKGDKNVYFIGNGDLFSCDHRDACTVDGVHPNDYGFVQMATGLLSIIKDL